MAGKVVCPAAGGEKAAIALTRLCTWLSSSVLPLLVLNCSTWLALPVYQLDRVNLSLVPMMLTSRLLATWRNQSWSAAMPASKRAMSVLPAVASFS